MQWTCRELHVKLKSMFGWGENKEDGKEEEENRVKNGIFSCLIQER